MSYKTGKGSTHETLRKIMKRGTWWTAAELQDAYEQETGEYRLDATLTRRLREMADVVCQCRRVRNSRGDYVWRDCYGLVKTKSKAAA